MSYYGLMDCEQVYRKGCVRSLLREDGDVVEEFILFLFFFFKRWLDAFTIIFYLVGAGRGHVNVGV